jgi:hypothetical protein
MDELLPSLHYGPIEAMSPEQNPLALFKLAHYPIFGIVKPMNKCAFKGF